MLGRKDPLDYLKERVHWADEGVVRERLKSHLISFDLLSKAHYGHLVGDTLKQKLQVNFDAFLRARAELIVVAMKLLTGGKEPSLEAVWDEHPESGE